MDFRKIFSTIPDKFDRYRPRYCDELFVDLIEYAKLAPGKTVLEVGPGTGQATDPILKTGCSYLAIELAENFVEFMAKKYRNLDNFQIVNADFETYDFSDQQFDLVFSAAAFQWIPEEIGYSKAFKILKSGGVFAMFSGNGGVPDEPLHTQCQEVYKKHFFPETPYTCKLDHEASDKYGFVDLEKRTYNSYREMNADEYVALRGTHSDHLTLPEPHKTNLFEGLRQVVLDNGDYIKLNDVYTLYLAKKP
ncbi:MAG: class I SAM-dependent methyltransferase [Oscillospiraceae bacterium]|nr:class I SAM-dependent methyltransferase [Oscillospiraceae bacterium]